MDFNEEQSGSVVHTHGGDISYYYSKYLFSFSYFIFLFSYISLSFYPMGRLMVSWVVVIIAGCLVLKKLYTTCQLERELSLKKRIVLLRKKGNMQKKERSTEALKKKVNCFEFREM
jgi:hypothetical protein